MKTGLYTDLSINDYHQGEGISASALKEVAKSTAHYFAYKNRPTDEGPTPEHFLIGHAFEDLLLEREKFANTYFIYDESGRPDPTKDFRSKENKAWKAEQLEAAAGLTVLNSAQFDLIKNMVASCEADHIAPYLKNIDVQHSYYWHDEATGLLCKTRPDVVKELPNGNLMVLDVKTTQDASPSGFAKSFCNLNYGVQAAMQIDGVEAVTGKKVEMYRYLVAEKTAPYCAQVYKLGGSDIEFCQIQYKNLLTKLKRGLENENYIALGYGEDTTTGVLELTLPNWYYTK